MGNFGDPIQGASSAVDIDPAQQALLDTPQEIIDENDPRLISEPLEMNLEGDAYAQPVPPPDATYHAKLKLKHVENDKKEKKDFEVKMTKRAPILPYLSTGIEARIIDPAGKFDNIPVYDSWVSTFTGRDNSSKISTILSHLKQPSGQPWAVAGQRMTHREWMDLFIKALAGEPEVRIMTAWEWSCTVCGEEAKKAGQAYPRSITGMTKFPQEVKNRQATYIPEMKCPVNVAHGYSRAQVRIAQVLSLV